MTPEQARTVQRACQDAQDIVALIIEHLDAVGRAVDPKVRRARLTQARHGVKTLGEILAVEKAPLLEEAARVLAQEVA